MQPLSCLACKAGSSSSGTFTLALAKLAKLPMTTASAPESPAPKARDPALASVAELPPEMLLRLLSLTGCCSGKPCHCSQMGYLATVADLLPMVPLRLLAAVLRSCSNSDRNYACIATGVASTRIREQPMGT